MYYSPNCKPDIKLNLEKGSVGVAAHLLAGNLKEEAMVVWWRETKEAPSHPCSLWNTGLPRNGASTSLSEGPSPSLSSRCWGGSETKGGARVVRASSPSTSIRFPLVFFLEPDVGDWCSYVSVFPRKTWAQFFRSSKHVCMFIRQRRISSWWCGPHCSWKRRSRVCSGKFWVSKTRPPHVSINTIIIFYSSLKHYSG